MLSVVHGSSILYYLAVGDALVFTLIFSIIINFPICQPVADASKIIFTSFIPGKWRKRESMDDYLV